jgi:hypothetical protein
MEFLDGASNLLGFVTSATGFNYGTSGGGTPNEIIGGGSFAADSAAVLISSSPFGNGTVVVDDITFEPSSGTPPPVPEPSTLLLIGSGVLALARAKYRDRFRHFSTR